MSRKIRTHDELVGKRVVVCESLLMTRKKALKQLSFRVRTCKVVKCRINKAGKLLAIYVVKSKCFGPKYQWRKTPIRIPAEYLNWPIRRIHTEQYERVPNTHTRLYRSFEPRRFVWKWEILSPWRIQNKKEHFWDSIQPKVVMGSRQRGIASSQWKFGAPTVAWWLNNENLIEQPVKKRYSEFSQK